MAVNISQFAAGGVDQVQWGVLDTTGVIMGTAGTIANGSDAGVGLIVGSKTADYSIPDPVRQNVTGDDRRLVTFQFDSPDPSAFNLEIAGPDLLLIARATGKTPRTIQGWDMNLLRPGSLTFRNITLLLTAQSKSLESGSFGSPGFANLLLPRVEMLYQGRSGITEQGIHVARFSCIANPTDLWPWGETLTIVDDGDTQADGVEWFSENRVSLHTHVGNNSDTTCTLAYTPAAESGAKAIAWQTGAEMTYGAGAGNYVVVASTKAWTFGTAPGTGVKSVLCYEYIE